MRKQGSGMLWDQVVGGERNEVEWADIGVEVVEEVWEEVGWCEDGLGEVFLMRSVGIGRGGILLG